MTLNYVTITGTFQDGSGTPLDGSAVFTPSTTAYAAGVPLFTTANPVSATISNGSLQASGGGALMLLATDNTGLEFEDLTGFFYWTVVVNLPGGSASFAFFLPHSPSTVDLFELANTAASASGVALLAGSTFTGYIAPAVVALTQSAGSVAVNAALGNDFRLTLTASGWTISNPTNPVDGQRIDFQLAQDATGSRTVSWGTAYDFGLAGAPTLTPTASKTDVIGFIYNAALAKWLCAGSAFGF